MAFSINRYEALAALLGSNPKAYRQEIARLYSEEPECFDAFIRWLKEALEEDGPRRRKVSVEALALGVSLLPKAKRPQVPR